MSTMDERTISNKATHQSHFALMNMLPVECRDAVINMACAAFDVLAVLAPNLGITSRMLEAQMAHQAIEHRADSVDMRMSLTALAVQQVITKAQADKGLPVSHIAPF